MNGRDRRSVIRNAAVCTGILAAAVLLSMILSGIHDDNNPFATPLFILAVAMIARLTDGYAWGIAASLVGTFCVNYMFTYPFWEFDTCADAVPLIIYRPNLPVLRKCLSMTSYRFFGISGTESMLFSPETIKGRTASLCSL